MQYPQKSEGKELKILVQPETQHRARYLTEGSRGSVKDRTQQGFPTVKVSVCVCIYQKVERALICSVGMSLSFWGFFASLIQCYDSLPIRF